MTSQRLHLPYWSLFLFLMLGIAPLGWTTDNHPNRIHRVVIPDEDRFKPYSLTISVGDTVEWVNNDTDDHTVVSDDFFNTVGKKLKKTNHLVPGTDNNHGQPGKFRLRFDQPGTFVYYCRFHSHLDGFKQPVAPGPGEDEKHPIASGIQGNTGGIPFPPGLMPDDNFGTPMTGVITVLPDDGKGQQNH